MPRQLEDFVKEQTALQHDLEGALAQLKEAEQRRAGYEAALQAAARAVGARVAALRAGGASGSSVDDFKTDPGVSKTLASLDEQLAPAAADRQRFQTLAAGGWKKALDRYGALDRDLAAEISARRKLAAAQAGQALPDLVRLQTDLHKKLEPRRAALQSGEAALLFHRDPSYFQKRLAERFAAELNTAPAAPPATAAAGKAPDKAAPGAPQPVRAAAAPAAPAKAPNKAAPATAQPALTAAAAAPVNPLLTAAAFKASGNQARQLFANVRRDTAGAKTAQKKKDGPALAAARAAAAQHLKELEALVKPYEAARKQAGEAAIAQLPNGRQLLTGIEALLALSARARRLVYPPSKGR